jgi:hypothetical protein
MCTITDIKQASADNHQKSVTVRSTADQVATAERMVKPFEKP